MSDTVEIVTISIAVYGAILSTYTILENRREKKPHIKVELNFAVPLMDARPVDPLLSFSIMNIGSRLVTVNSIGLILPRNQYYFFPYIEGDITFPFGLGAGKSHHHWVDVAELAYRFKKEGYRGSIKLIGFYKDSLNNCYKSKDFKFHIDDLISKYG